MSGDIIEKGQEVNLQEKNPALRSVMVGLGWDLPSVAEGVDFDLDASAFLLDQNNRTRRDTDFVFYNNLSTEEEAIVHHGDNPTGAGEGDDEVITINLEKLPFDIQKIAFSVTIHNADEREQNFGMVSNAFIRIVDQETNEELIRFNLTHDASKETGMLFGELYRDGSAWHFRSLGQGTDSGLYGIAKGFGVNVAEP